MRAILHASFCFDVNWVFLHVCTDALLAMRKLIWKSVLPWCSPRWPFFAIFRYGEKMHKMVRGDDNVYDELFSYACPKVGWPCRSPVFDLSLLSIVQYAFAVILH